jgi:hypothetical protein
MGPIMQNKPNSGQPNRCPGDDYAKQSQTWAGWDIWEAACQGRPMAQNESNLPGGPGRPPSPPKPIMQNKPNSWPCRGDEAWGRGPWGKRAKQSQFPGGAGWDGVRGTANEGQMRKTNPISEGVLSVKLQV